jgi:hypothetical protein
MELSMDLSNRIRDKFWISFRNWLSPLAIGSALSALVIFGGGAIELSEAGPNSEAYRKIYQNLPILIVAVTSMVLFLLSIVLWILGRVLELLDRIESGKPKQQS